MPKCWSCGKEVDPKKSYGIYSHLGHKYYCDDPRCQERFIEDAGDPPDEPYESPQTHREERKEQL